MKPKTLIILILLVLFLIVLLQNTQVVTLRFFFWEIAVSRIILLVATVLVGFVVGYIVAAISAKGEKNT